MISEFFEHRLNNGLRIAVERMEGVNSVASGFLCRTGARDEAPQFAGVSHFLEHMCFKGAEKRSGREINLEFDRIGGQHNAFTSQDRTFYHCTSRAAEFERQIDILADMMRSVLPPDEFEMEKNVVLEEIAMSNDRIEGVTFDLVLERAFAGHSLGWPVLGYQQTLKPLTRDQMYAYFRRRYVPNNMMLVVAGRVDPDEVFEVARRYCGQWPAGEPAAPRVPPKMQSGVAIRKVDRFNQQMLALNFAAPSATDPLHETAQAVAAILGGGNSRFHWNIEQAGLSPHAGAYRLDYADCGMLILMAQCDPENAERVLDAMRQEAKRLMYEPVADSEIQRVKNKRRTSLAVEGESPHHRLLQVMDDVDYRSRPRTVEERLAAVEAVNHDSIRAYFEGFPIDGEGLLVSVGPRAFPAAA